eukprot:NODE_8466_length_549_cov_55.291469_g8443_i0.p1 GENE.NODE_8466_length_549_cov_55.291469_g8443_i0~~NODE_8466_length_549_cov_55.291469_g8443_i0.p1  ORF type:complete len:139 (-),score=18.56 NODE_8466_length_549_cov_55.291469_g8443_i0:23-439(-)
MLATADQLTAEGCECHDALVRCRPVPFGPDFAEQHPDLWQASSVVVGMHPDEPTEDIVDLSLAHGKPFAVVPCCVFWKRRPDRRTPAGEQVRTHTQFCEYLAAKDARITTTELPFAGRNVVLYWNADAVGDAAKRAVY